MNILAEKTIIIEQFRQVNDASLYITEAHEKLVIERFDKVSINPESLLDCIEAKKTLNLRQIYAAC